MNAQFGFTALDLGPPTAGNPVVRSDIDITHPHQHPLAPGPGDRHAESVALASQD